MGLEAASWAAQALTLRAERDLGRSDGAAGYERNLELWEGLARYVQHRASGDASLPFPADGGWPAEADRDRAYVSGAALALLLDRLRPDWNRALEEEGGATLDGLLDDVLREVEPAGFALRERENVESRALADAADVEAGRRRAAQAFIEREGTAVQVVVADGAVLSPQRFDPLNVRLLEGRLVLHSRLLRLERPGASIEVLGAECLTQGAGSHPLFGGVQSLLLTGLPEDFTPSREGGAVKLTAPGLEATFTGAEVERLPGRPFWRLTLR